ncbi:hypothetical protein [Lysinibacillus sp. CTST325]
MDEANVVSAMGKSIGDAHKDVEQVVNQKPNEDKYPIAYTRYIGTCA